MNKKIKALKEKFKIYDIDGYIVPKNDNYFTEYSKINRLKIISNFSGSAGLAIILKNKNYLFTDGRYTIQSHIESGKNFKIISYEKILNCNLFKITFLSSEINGELAKTASEVNKTSISFKPFLNKVEPLETISQIPSAKPIFGAISTEPLMM